MKSNSNYLVVSNGWGRPVANVRTTGLSDWGVEDFFGVRFVPVERQNVPVRVRARLDKHPT